MVERYETWARSFENWNICLFHHDQRTAKQQNRREIDSEENNLQVKIWRKIKSFLGCAAANLHPFLPYGNFVDEALKNDPLTFGFLQRSEILRSNAWSHLWIIIHNSSLDSMKWLKILIGKISLIKISAEMSKDKREIREEENMN